MYLANRAAGNALVASTAYHHMASGGYPLSVGSSPARRPGSGGVRHRQRLSPARLARGRRGEAGGPAGGERQQAVALDMYRRIRYALAVRLWSKGLLISMINRSVTGGWVDLKAMLQRGHPAKKARFQSPAKAQNRSLLAKCARWLARHWPPGCVRKRVARGSQRPIVLQKQRPLQGPAQPATGTAPQGCVLGLIMA